MNQEKAWFLLGQILLLLLIVYQQIALSSLVFHSYELIMIIVDVRLVWGIFLTVSKFLVGWYGVVLQIGKIGKRFYNRFSPSDMK